MSKLSALTRRLIDQLRRTDYLVLLVALAALLSSWTFLEIADQMVEGETRRLDEWVLRSLRHPADPSIPVGPGWLRETVRDLTALGGFSVLLIVTTAVVLYLWLSRTYHAMWLVLGSAVGGQCLSTALKAFYDRPRPALVPHLVYAEFSSFPSGHSMNAAAVYLTLGLLLARLTEHRRLKIYFLGIALLLTLVVGLSRVYLGVHYPTDVLAGWAAGAAWAAGCWLLAGYLQRRGTVEQHPNDPDDPPDSGATHTLRGPGDS